MRLGEVRNVLYRAISQDDRLIYEVEQVYDQHQYKINRYQQLADALIILRDFSWVKPHLDIIDKLLDLHGRDVEFAIISAGLHKSLENTINALNTRIPILCGIFDEFIQHQDEQTINVMLPTAAIKTIETLNSFNEELDEVFKLIVKHKGLNGDVKLAGFDTGSSWYEFIITGAPFAYGAVLGLVALAKKSLELRTEWYQSEELRLSAEIKKATSAEKQKSSLLSDSEFRQHIDEMVALKVEAELSKITKTISGSNPNENETKNSLRIGLKKIQELMAKGTEFHPSLNPPDYVQIDNRKFSIDYSKIPKIDSEEKTLKLEGPTEKKDGKSR